MVYSYLSFEDKILISSLRVKGYGAKKIIKSYPERNWKLSTVSYFLRHLLETNGAFQMKPGRGRKKTGRSIENVERVRGILNAVEPGNTISSRKITKTTTIKRSSVRRIIKIDLKYRPFKKIYCHKFSNDVKNKRVERCQALLRRFRRRDDIERIWFSDEKVFSLRQPKNSQNNRVYSNVQRKSEIPLEHLLVPRDHFSKSVMVSLAVSMLGKTEIYFIGSGVKINSEVYQRDILEGMLREIEIVSDNYTFQQDGAPSHTSRSTVRYLQENCPDFIEPNMWPPNSPELNPVDYNIWGTLEGRVYENARINTIDQLKERIVYCWQQYNQEIINNSIGQWRRRLQAVVDNQGGHIHNNFL